MHTESSAARVRLNVAIDIQTQPFSFISDQSENTRAPTVLKRHRNQLREEAKIIAWQ
ncbi:hypothetical protein ACO22_04308 [Paracoccidioides brasiliensis]|uniref:Uncharacterized protein n=1 Tax=Paracoccidioides brasiliensis TaxID=121759 RepID=A0A1D2JDJ9_PARBR|nr:hypothetical protein ACO22_04308 [Paracoccidioides brasiliensis]